MRIVGGRFRGKKLVSPEGRDAVRPTSDRTRESVFNVLMHRFQGTQGWALIGARALDAFAGTGAMGLEALSRGVSHVTFLETGTEALTALEQNIEVMGAERDAAVVRQDATNPPPASIPVQLAFLDPPYRSDVIEDSLTALSERGWFDTGAIIVCEHAFNTDIEPPTGFVLIDSRRYGKTKVTFLRWEG